MLSRSLPWRPRAAALANWRSRSSLLDLGVVAALMPLFFFPWRWPALTLVALFAIPLAWVLRWRRTGQLTARTGMEAPLVYVLLATCLATVPITDWQLGLPKLLGMVLGAATMVAVSNTVTSRPALSRAVVAVAALALLLSGVGLVGVEWAIGKMAALDPVYSRLPVLVRGVVPNTRDGGIHPNELAGTLVLLLPVLLAPGLGLLFSGRRSPDRLWLGGVVLCGLVGLIVLAATQSRSGLAGAGVALSLLGGAGVARIVRAGRVPWLLRVLTVLGYVAVLAAGGWLGWQMLGHWMSASGGSESLDTFESRVELWNRAGYMLQDFPFTGIGLGQFSPVLHALYVPFLIAPDTFMPHAHNIYLEYALELGIPGAVAFGCLLVVFFRRCLQAVGSDDPLLRWTGLGLALGMLGFLAYGLTDAIAPGARAGLVVWVVMGLGGAVGRLTLAPKLFNGPNLSRNEHS